MLMNEENDEMTHNRQCQFSLRVCDCFASAAAGRELAVTACDGVFSVVAI